MLKNCFLPVQYNYLQSKICGEIICQSETSFSINCNFCKLKIFEFSEFVQHFRTTHWSEIKPADISNKPDVNEETFPTQRNLIDENLIKPEIYEENKLLYQQYPLHEPDEDHDENNQHEWSADLEENQSDKSIISSNVDDETSDMLETIGILKKKLASNKPKERSFKCNLCTRSFSIQSNYETHILTHERLEFQCDKCSRSFADESLLFDHQHMHNGYSCDICNKVYAKKDSLRFHKEIHIQTKNFVCQYKNCNKAFASQRRLNQHTRLTHLLTCNFVCEVCGSRQWDKKALINHKRSHTGEKPFNCIICDRRFMTKSLLLEHKACHETERKHVCEVCGKSFNRPKALYHHKHLHLSVKKFVCKLCGAAYAQGAGLSAHMRKHKENKIIADKQIIK
ncbi:zinc finger protein OZF-like [Calliphora vicina]|uniref:zinc finger protein OZF-like n=1 Tax=Calliphora vicina TaxID=7373 RepID=UPI00325C151A